MNYQRPLHRFAIWCPVDENGPGMSAFATGSRVDAAHGARFINHDIQKNGPAKTGIVSMEACGKHGPVSNARESTQSCVAEQFRWRPWTRIHGI
jgi:hypothetical protein